jgi:hypothetical protein
MMSYKPAIPRGRWCDITVLHAHAPHENRSGDNRIDPSSYEEIERVMDKFPTSHMNILLGYFSTN